MIDLPRPSARACASSAPSTAARPARRTFHAALVAAALAATGCAKPEPPTLRPLDVATTRVDETGLGLRVRLEAQNPNRVPLVAQRVSGHLTLAGGTIDLGTVSVDQALTLPAKSTTVVEVPLTMRWQNLGALGMLAAQTPTVPYAIEGTVTVGGERLNVELPFTLTGTLQRDDLVRAALRGIPTLPGLPGLTPPP